MFKISRRQTILRASLLGCLVIAVLSTAAYFIINQQKDTNAATTNNELVKVRYYNGTEHVIHYGTGDNGNGANTRPYEVINHLRYDSDDGKYKASSTSEYYRALCAQPKQDNPTGDTYEAVLLTGSTANPVDTVVNPIKLLMWIWLYGDSNTRTTIYGTIDDDNAWGGSQSDRRIAFTHAAIGYMYRSKGDYEENGDTRGLSSAEINQLKDVINRLKSLINQNNAAWQNASSYNLFRTRASSEDDDISGTTGQQDVVWIEPTGKIIVRKRDNETRLFGPQGNGSFNNITFTLSDGTTSISQTLTNGATSVTFTNLDPNKRYTISESGGNNTYSFIPAKTNIAPTAAGTEVIFDNTIKKGKLTVNKIDKDTGTCTNTLGLNFAGTTFQLINNSTNSIYYNGAIIAKGSVIINKTMASGECSFEFDQLPYGTYILKETAASTGYVLDSTERSFTIPTDNETNISYTFENQPIRGDVKFVKNDPANNKTMANAVFEISSISNSYIENHIVITDENGVVDTSANPHTFNTNGYDAPYHANEDNFLPYAGYGTWFGIDNNHQAIRPRDDVGALPYGSYLIQELKCDAFLFCNHTNNEKRMFTITANDHNKVVDLGDWDNDCAPFTLATTATDNSDGDHYIEAGQDTVIKDVVTYCAKTGFTFTIKGILMDKATNQPLLINGETVEQSVEISPTDNDCGTVEMLFPLNSSDLAGKSVVVFERLYYKNELKSSHEDINDPGQTVDIVSLGTVAVDNSDDDKLIVPGEETVIKDTVSYCLPTSDEHSTFWTIGTLIDKTTGNSILVNGEPVTKRSESIYRGCGTVDLLFELDTSLITGKPIVVFEELWVYPGDGFGPEHKIISHEDLNDEDQTVYPIDISTTVQPTEDGTKVFPFDSDVTVTDMVHYCLQPGLEYTVKGIVMDKSTGNGLLVDSKLVEQSLTFTPTEVCGEFPMYYTFNTKGLAGAQLVIFESLYYDDELLIEHKDIDNELESFEIDITPPETGFITRNQSGSQESSHQELIVIAIIATVPIIAYSLNRYRVRKSFLNR